jgi:hypothetical protein
MHTPCYSATPRPRLWLPTLVLTVVLVAMAGCQSVNHLRDAQEAFNRAATLENKLRYAANDPNTLFKTEASEALTEVGSVQSSYAAALLSLENVDEAKLKQDRLWGSALTLKALTQWRLGRYEDALTTANTAKANSNQLFPRDAAIVEALPGLIKIDLAYARIRQMKPFLKKTEDISSADLEQKNQAIVQENTPIFLKEIKPRLVGDTGEAEGSAVQDLHRARAQVEPDRPVHIYLIQAQLAALRNYEVAYTKCYGDTPPADDPAQQVAAWNLWDLQEILQKNAGADYPGSDGQRWIARWEARYALKAKQRPL